MIFFNCTYLLKIELSQLFHIQFVLTFDSFVLVTQINSYLHISDHFFCSKGIMLR